MIKGHFGMVVLGEILNDADEIAVQSSKWDTAVVGLLLNNLNDKTCG